MIERKTIDAAPSGSLPLAQAVMEFSIPVAGHSETWPERHNRLTSVLAKVSGAKECRIDPERQRFEFVWPDCIRTPYPWSLLEAIPRRRVPSIDGTFPKDGWSEQMHATRDAIDRVWSGLMLEAFNEGVRFGHIKLLGRINSVSGDFVEIPSDIWPSAIIEDWLKGHVSWPDRQQFWFVRACLQKPAAWKKGRPPDFDQDHINAFVRGRVKERGYPRPDGDMGWRTRADVESEIGALCLEHYGREPAKSTLQRYAKIALAQLAP